MNTTSKLRKRIAGVFSVICILGLLTSGTYAIETYEQLVPETDIVQTSMTTFSLPLNGRHWSMDNPTKKNEYTVTNNGNGDIYVRVQFKEFLSITQQSYPHTSYRCLVAPPNLQNPDSSDFVDDVNAALSAKGVPTAQLAQYGRTGYQNFVSFASHEAAKNFLQLMQSDAKWSATPGQWGNTISPPLQALNDFERYASGKLKTDDMLNPIPVTRYYIITEEKGAAGQYGKALPLAQQDVGDPVIYTSRNGVTPPNASEDAVLKHTHGTLNCQQYQEATGRPCPTGRPGHENGECNYLVHPWNMQKGAVCDMGCHEFVRWNLPENNIITFEEWENLPADQKLVDKWILDTTSSGGWAYWGRPLKPKVTTLELMESLTLLKQPEGRGYYAIHIDLEAVSQSDLALWRGNVPESNKAPDELVDVLNDGSGVSVKITPASGAQVRPGGTLQFTAAVTGMHSQEVEWSVSSGYPHITIDETGLLTVGTGQTSAINSVRVTARTKIGNKVGHAYFKVVL